MPTQTGFLENTNLPEVIMVNIALEKPYKLLKDETQKFYSGGFFRGVFVLGCCPGGFVGDTCPGGFCPRTDF